MTAVSGGARTRGQLGLDTDVVDERVLERTVGAFRAARIRLPTFDEIADPARVPAEIERALAAVEPDVPGPLNLFRVHWFNGPDRRTRLDVPGHVVLPEALTGVPAPIIVAFGDRFPLIRAHKVLAAYSCLVPRVVTGAFDPTEQRAIWPSTGNYCRGGVAISRILGCRGVAVLPEGMSAERFEWLARWVTEPTDVVRTPGSESNVKEIYDACDELARDPANVIFNQFCEFGNHLGHYTATGRALSTVFEALRATRPGLRLAGFVSASGSAGTLGAGDWLKERHGAAIMAVEALECPTLLYNGFGEHNIQGIGDKHVPYIHNVTNTDVVCAISDVATDELNVLFNTDAGRRWLSDEAGIPAEVVATLAHFGCSSICNVLAAIELAKHRGLGPDDAVITVATDGAELYASELDKSLDEHFGGRFEADTAARVFERHLRAPATEHLLELGPRDRDRIFNLGYFTWVEQRGVALGDFEARRSQDFWRGLRELVPAWNRRIEEFNQATGA